MINLTPSSFFRIAIVSWIMVIYLIATGNLHWYIWPFVGLIIVERVVVAVILWLETQMIKAAAQRMMQQFQERGDDPLAGLGGLGRGPDIP